jgi:type I restriction enzyme S subunit
MKLSKTPFKLSHNELLLSVSATIILLRLQEMGISDRTVGEICTPPQYGFTTSACIESCGPKFLRITDIKNGKVDWPEVPFCGCEPPPNYQLSKGTFLLPGPGRSANHFL